MAKFLVAAGLVIAVLWLGAWVSDRGVLVWSEETRLGGRTCSYLIGVTVVKQYGNFFRGRCPVLSKV